MPVFANLKQFRGPPIPPDTSLEHSQRAELNRCERYLTWNIRTMKRFTFWSSCLINIKDKVLCGTHPWECVTLLSQHSINSVGSGGNSNRSSLKRQQTVDRYFTNLNLFKENMSQTIDFHLKRSGMVKLLCSLIVHSIYLNFQVAPPTPPE